jgi:tRNA (mo5U34)-methyltransferase
MDPDQLRAEIDRLGPWHYDVEVAPGIRTAVAPPSGDQGRGDGIPSIIPADIRLAELVGELWPEGLAGRSFLDCACNGGGYLFAAQALGASRCFGFDVRERWIDQVRFLARHLPSDRIGFARADLAALPGMDLPMFDVTLFSGLLYHIPDPAAGLRIAADRTKELLIVNTAIQPGPEDGLVLTWEESEPPMLGVHGLAWLPTSSRTVAAMLAWCGFPHVRLRFDMDIRAPGRRRIDLLAARDAATFDYHDERHPDRQLPAAPPAAARPASALRSRLRRLLRR